MKGKIDGKRERGRPKRQWERDIRDVFDTVSLSEVGRFIIDRNRFRCAFNDKQLTSGSIHLSLAYWAGLFEAGLR